MDVLSILLAAIAGFMVAFLMFRPKLMGTLLVKKHEEGTYLFLELSEDADLLDKREMVLFRVSVQDVSSRI